MPEHAKTPSECSTLEAGAGSWLGRECPDVGKEGRMAHWGAERAPGLVSRLVWGNGTKRGHAGEARYLLGSTERVPEEELKQQQNRNRKSEGGSTAWRGRKTEWLGDGLDPDSTHGCMLPVSGGHTHARTPARAAGHALRGGEGGEPQPWNPQPPTSGKRRFEGGPLPGSPRKCRKQSHGGCKESKPPSQSQL